VEEQVEEGGSQDLAAGELAVEAFVLLKLAVDAFLSLEVVGQLSVLRGVGVDRRGQARVGDKVLLDALQEDAVLLSQLRSEAFIEGFNNSGQRLLGLFGAAGLGCGHRLDLELAGLETRRPITDALDTVTAHVNLVGDDTGQFLAANGNHAQEQSGEDVELLQVRVVEGHDLREEGIQPHELPQQTAEVGLLLASLPALWMGSGGSRRSWPRPQAQHSGRDDGAGLRYSASAS